MTGWIDIGPVEAIPLRGARTILAGDGREIAVFRTGDGAVYALENRCPHKNGPLSQGIVHGHTVACPLHNWVISLKTGEAQGADKGCTPTISVKAEADRILVQIPASPARAA